MSHSLRRGLGRVFPPPPASSAPPLLPTHTPHSLAPLSLGVRVTGSARGRLSVLLLAAVAVTLQRWWSGLPNSLGDVCSSQGPCRNRSWHRISSSMKKKIAQPEQGRNESRCVLGMTPPGSWALQFTSHLLSASWRRMLVTQGRGWNQKLLSTRKGDIRRTQQLSNGLTLSPSSLPPLLGGERPPGFLYEMSWAKQGCRHLRVPLA